MLSTVRHDEVFPPRLHHLPINIIGAGAIGSRVFAALFELGLDTISTFDFDDVEAHNLANQIYGNADVGTRKVTALAHWAETKLDVRRLPDTLHFRDKRVERGTELIGTVFLLVDSMEQRRKIFEECIVDNYNVPRVIDVRMASTHGNVFTFNPHSQGEQWLATLIDDDQAEVSACGTSLTVGTTASILSNIAVWQFMHSVTNPEARDDIINVFLKPLTIATSSWSRQ